MQDFQVSKRLEFSFTYIYLIITLFVLTLFFCDLTLLFFGALMIAGYFIDKQLYQRILLIIITGTYLCLSFFFATRLDPLLAVQLLTLQNALGNITILYIFVGGAILLGNIMGLYMKRLRFEYFTVIVLGMALTSTLLDLLVFHVISSKYILTFLLYVVSYFLVYGLQLLFWFLLIFGLIKFLTIEVIEQETRVTIKG